MHQFLNMMMGIFSLTMMIDFVVVVYKGFRVEDIRVPLLILVISFVGVIIINELLFIFSG
ncbi:MAG: hypothetical protein HXK75_04020 [Granulicatella sp.]|nr:hypothetical protein [Granulicatella sp.]